MTETREIGIVCRKEKRRLQNHVSGFVLRLWASGQERDVPLKENQAPSVSPHDAGETPDAHSPGLL